MPRARTYTTTGVVLRQYPLGEADRIIVILTPDHGKVRAVAKGVRRPKGKLRGHLDLTNVVDFSASYGRSLDIITEAMILDDHPATRTDLARLSQAMYVCELSDLFTEERAPSRRLYDLVTTTLNALDADANLWLLIRWFEQRLLDVTGFRPQLEQCVECGDELRPADHVLDLAAGGVLCPNCRSLGYGRKIAVSQSAMRVLRHLRRAPDVESVGAPKLPDRVREDVERIQSRYLRAIIERDIKSAEFTRQAALGKG